jgi:RNA recognition motif. (a.k.a. RRM, RBD, or RNP domain)
VTSEDLFTYFSKIGAVRNAYLIYDPITKISKGFGYVEFHSIESAEKALSVHVHQLLGKNVSVQRQRNGLRQSKILQKQFQDSSRQHKLKEYYPKTKEYSSPVSSHHCPPTYSHKTKKENNGNIWVDTSRKKDPPMLSGKHEPSTRSTFETRRNPPNQSSCSISFVKSSYLLGDTQSRNLDSVILLSGHSTTSKVTSSRKEFYRHLKLLSPISNERLDDSNYTYVIESALSTALRRRRLVNYLQAFSNQAIPGCSIADVRT